MYFYFIIYLTEKQNLPHDLNGFFKNLFDLEAITEDAIFLINELLEEEIAVQQIHFVAK